MNDKIINELSLKLNVSLKSIKSTLELLKDGNTIPFIARYRKEATGNLNEIQIKEIEKEYLYEVNLLKRKEEVIRLIDEKGLLTLEIKENIFKCSKLVEVEDVYRPFKEKKKTKATDAINNGLEPLAKIIMSSNFLGNPELVAEKYLNNNVKNVHEALEGVKYIIAEWISDNAFYRKAIRNIVENKGMIISKKKKNSVDDSKTYEMYYDYEDMVKKIPSYRILAINRGEKENILQVTIKVEDEIIIEYLKNKIIKNSNILVNEIILLAIKDSYKRLIFPSIEREIRGVLKEKADLVAIKNFSDNLEKLLMQPPLKEKNILGFDPAYRTGCKLAVIDKSGNLLKIDVIYPHEPKKEYDKSKEKIIKLIKDYNIKIVAIGNGTASRESEEFIVDVIKTLNNSFEYIIVNEAGASVYSASDVAIKEFPNLHVEERSAVSIGRRLQDPLSELVKITPESIGIGLYQHDVSKKDLVESLNFAVEKVVNDIGVNINTASPFILKYISGMTKSAIDKIIKYRNEHGKIKKRSELSKILSPKVYEQSIGFLRVLNGDNVFDSTSIHPENYNDALNILNYISEKIENIGSEELIKKLDYIDKVKLMNKFEIDKYTLDDILDALKKPHRDPRDIIEKPLLRKDVLKFEDLKVGMKLQGTVRNVVDFGAFVDIGIKNDGLIHISKMSSKFLKHPSEILSVGNIVDVSIDEINVQKQKVSLRLN